MDNIYIQQPKFHQSITGALDTIANDYLTVNEDNGKIATAAKLAGGTLAYTALALVGLVETVGRNAFVTLAKTGHFFVPAKLSEMLNLDGKILSLFSHAEVTSDHTAQATARIITNFMSESKRDDAESSIDYVNSKFYGSNVMQSLLHARLGNLLCSSEQAAEENVEEINETEDEVQPIVNNEIDDVQNDEIDEVENNDVDEDEEIEENTSTEKKPSLIGKFFHAIGIIAEDVR